MVQCNLGLQSEMVSKKLVQSSQKVELALICAIVVSPKRVQDKLLEGHATRCNLSETCHATLLRHKLQRKFHRVKLSSDSNVTVVAT